jgi:WD40 repeat protein
MLSVILLQVRAIVALAFSPGDGDTLVTVGSDNGHSLFIWKWMTDPDKKRYIIASRVRYVKP